MSDGEKDDFVHRVVGAAGAPPLTPRGPNSPFAMGEAYLALPEEPAAVPLAPVAVSVSTAVDQEEAPLRCSFYENGITQFVLGIDQRFLSVDETLQLGARLVAHAAAAKDVRLITTAAASSSAPRWPF